MNKYDVVIGVEIHIELKTKTKCFSPAANTFAEIPNSQVNAIDCGYPGTLPAINKKVVISAIKLASALNMTIDPVLVFDRKNYFYSDLPKGYQITQFFHPIGKNGFLPIVVNNEEFVVKFERVHIEEDTAKQIHEGKLTLIDYNRAGVPLLELVSLPIFSTAEQVITYISNLRHILIFLGISDAKMNEGSLRCDINLSLKPKNNNTLGTKVEIKNLNSLNNIKLAIEYEIKRQTLLLDQKTTFSEQTRRFDEKSSTTVLMRNKTTQVDYKYFPEPNIFPIKLDEQWIKNIIARIPLLPKQVADNLNKTYHLSQNEIDFLIDRFELIDFFIKTCQINQLAKNNINYLMGPVQAYLNTSKVNTVNETKLTPQNLAELIILIQKNKVNDKQSKLILSTIAQDNKNSPEQLLKKWDSKIIDNSTEIKSLIKNLFDQFPEMVATFQSNEIKANKFFMGQLMKITKGQIEPKIAQKIIDQIIQKKD